MRRHALPSRLLRRPPLCAEIALELFADDVEIGRVDAGGLFSPSGPRPYWAIAWPGGQALARALLDRPELVRGRLAVDVGCGSGIVAIAAALAGARRVLACDPDPAARRAVRRNARQNGVSIRTAARAPTRPPADAVLLIGDCFYETEIVAELMGLIHAYPSAWLADCDRGLLDPRGLELVERRRATAVPNVETDGEREATLYAKPSRGAAREPRARGAGPGILVHHARHAPRVANPPEPPPRAGSPALGPVRVKNPLPPMPHGITPKWLTAELRESGLLPASDAVASVAFEPVGEGVGMMSELARVRVTYQCAPVAAPASFIAKFPSQNATNRTVAMSYRLYEREVRYFAELDSLTQAKTPRQFIARLDGDNFLLLMEDLGDYRAGDQRVGASLEETRLAIDELAKLHAAFWGKTAAIDWVPGVAVSYHADNMAALLVPGWPSMLKHFGAFVPDAIARQGDAFRAALPALQARMAGAPATLLHGDFRMENFLFGTRPEHHPLVIIDWQGPLLGNGMIDVALLLAQSTRTEVRRAAERDLLVRYVEGLRHHGISAYSPENALADYEVALLYSWCYVAVVSGTLDASNPRAFAWMSQMVSRQAAAAQDHDSFRALA